MEQNQTQVQAQKAIERARAEDLKILESYKGQDVILNMHSNNSALGGRLTNIGNEFIYLIFCRGYKCDIANLTAHNIGDFARLPDTTLARKDISQIVLMDDLYNRLSEKEGDKTQ